MSIAELDKKTINLKIGRASDDSTAGSNSTDRVYGDTLSIIADLSKRLNVLEDQISLSVPTDKIMSKLLLTKEAALLTADKVAILGEVTIVDYIRDQNGQATGVIDPKITQIIGDKIRTGTILSTNWGLTEGTKFDLNTGDLIIGGYNDPRLQYDAVASTLSVRGAIKVVDSALEYGLFKTGTADYDGALSGDGVLIGTPGIFGLNSSHASGYSFALSASTGNVIIGDDTNNYMFYEMATGSLNVNGKVLIKDVGNPVVTDKWGYLATGTASFSNVGGPTGSGVIIGTPGIYGFHNGEMKFGFDAVTGDLILKGALTVGSSIDGGILIGSKTGAQMQNDTTVAQISANSAQNTADGAQLDATTALSNVASHSYIATILENSSASIETNSQYFIKIGTTTDGLYLGSAGLYGKKGGVTQFSIDSSGNATFSGSLSAASGSFSGEIYTSTGIHAVVTNFKNSSYAGYFNGGSGGGGIYCKSGSTFFPALYCDGKSQFAGNSTFQQNVLFSTSIQVNDRIIKPNNGSGTIYVRAKGTVDPYVGYDYYFV